MRQTLLFLILISTATLFFQCQSKDSTIQEKSAGDQFDVVIDAAHGGKDSGVILSGQNVNEKDIVLKISKMIKKYLDDQGIKTLLTRTDDSFVSLKDRVSKVDGAKANLVLSLHLNISKDSTMQGFETYYQEDNPGSRQLAEIIHKELGELELLKDTGSYPGPFYMLAEVPVNSVTLELGYLTNENDFNILTNTETRQKVATVLAEAIKIYQQN